MWPMLYMKSKQKETITTTVIGMPVLETAII